MFQRTLFNKVLFMEPSKFSSATYARATVFMQESVIEIEPDGEVKFLNGSLSPTQLAALAVISEVLCRIRYGKDLSPYVPEQDSFDNDQQIIRCKWQKKSGRLSVIGPLEEGKTPYKLVATMEEAVKLHGMFCCRKSLIELLPPKREIKQKGMEWEAVGVNG